MKISEEYRALALDALRGKWKTAVLAGIVASVFGANIVGGSSTITSHTDQSSNFSMDLFSDPNGGKLLTFLVACIVILAVVTLIVGGFIRLGYAHFNLNLVDGKDAAISDLFAQKNRLKDGFCMNLLLSVYTILWTLLFIIPGLVKSYSYAMTPYIMAEHPFLTANEAITESCRIMDGNKWRLLCLDFSFIGWELLGALPMWIGYYLFFGIFHSSDAMAVSIVLLLSIPLSIGFFFVRTYEEAAWAEFYRDITTVPAEDTLQS